MRARTPLIPENVVMAAREMGELSPGRYRVVVWESNGDLRVSDYGDLERARQYANDAASESDEPTPLAYVFDEKLNLVTRGRHYTAL